MDTKRDTIATSFLGGTAEGAEDHQEPVDFDEAFNQLPPNVQIGYKICLTLDMNIGSDFAWCDLTEVEIFGHAMKCGIGMRRIEKGLVSGLSKEGIVRGIESAKAIWSTAESWAEDLYGELLDNSDEDSEGQGFSDCGIDCFVSACADEDDALHDVRMRDPLLYTAICVELSRAANRGG